MARVLFIDDEPEVRTAVERRLQRHGFEVETADCASAGIAKIEASEPPFDVIVTDMSMEDADSGLRVLQAAFAKDLFAEVIVLTAYGTVSNAVECMRRGAFDYVEKNTPGIDVFEILTMKVERAIERRRQDVRTVELWERTAKSKQNPN
jgi:DNA-binding NtrC family response regulator